MWSESGAYGSNRWLRNALRDVRRGLAPWVLLGSSRECPLCGGRFRRFIAQDAESWRQEDALCPRCDSQHRQRVLWLYLMRETELRNTPSRVLHFAPEWCLYRRLRAMPTVDYVTADLEPSSLSPEPMDITDIPLPDASVDLVLCNHVLEHVEDDHKALTELRRVIRPSGRALLTVPIDPTLERTYEDRAVTSPEGRLRVYGQSDHVRIYGNDFEQRVRHAGFAVDVVPYSDQLPRSEVERYGLDDGSDFRSQDIHVCRCEPDRAAV